MTKKLLLLTACLLFAFGCGSGGALGDLGGILGSTSTNDPSDVRGVVSRIDTSAQRIDLDVNTVNNLRDEVSNTSIYYDSRTVVDYQGREYRPDQLERGDEISIRGVNREGRYVADRISVTRNVRN